MMWDLEDVTVVGEDRVIRASVSESRPSGRQAERGSSSQRITLLIPTGEHLAPPTRLTVRGRVVRVVGTQAPPFAAEPSLVTCELVTLDLPDTVQIVAPGARVLDKATGRFVTASTVEWTGAAHVASGLPSAVDVAGEESTLDKVTITLPLDAPSTNDREVHVVTARTPALVGAVFRVSGEVLDSSADARRVIGYRQGA